MMSKTSDGASRMEESVCPPSEGAHKVSTCRVMVMQKIYIVLILGVIFWGCTGSGEMTQSYQPAARSGSGALQASDAPTTQSPAAYTIKAGDSLDVTVWGYNEFNTKATVRQGGMIIVPLVGEMKVEGLTKEEFI